MSIAGERQGNQRNRGVLFLAWQCNVQIQNFIKLFQHHVGWYWADYDYMNPQVGDNLSLLALKKLIIIDIGVFFFYKLDQKITEI